MDSDKPQGPRTSLDEESAALLERATKQIASGITSAVERSRDKADRRRDGVAYPEGYNPEKRDLLKLADGGDVWVTWHVKKDADGKPLSRTAVAEDGRVFHQTWENRGWRKQATSEDDSVGNASRDLPAVDSMHAGSRSLSPENAIDNL